MAIVPTGAPAWVRSSDHTTYGGDQNKTNWHTQGATNPRTDVAAEAFCRLADDLAACMRTAPFCTLTMTCDDATPANPSVTVVNQMTGVRVTSYAGGSPPAGFPTCIRNGNGDVTITWATSYTDDYGVAGNVHIVHHEITAHGSVALIPVGVLTDTNVDGLNEAVRVRIFTTAGAAAASPTFSLSVCTGTA
jgi:hypothetical protein